MGKITPLFNDRVYYKVRVSFKDAPKVFDRILLVREDISLCDFGSALTIALGSEQEHFFYFSNRTASFVPDNWCQDRGYIDGDVPMTKYSFRDLGDEFDFEYDTGDSWEFKCKVYKKTFSLADQGPCIFKSGNGQGIWEDNSYAVRMMLWGELDPETSTEDEENGICFPWNYEIEKFGDFFCELSEDDISDIQSDMDSLLEHVSSEYYIRMTEGVDEDEYASDDDNVFDESDDDFNEIMENVNEFFLSVCAHQIDNVPFVKETFAKLEKKYGPDKAFDKVFEVFIGELQAFFGQNAPYGQSEYTNKLKKLK